MTFVQSNCVVVGWYAQVCQLFGIIAEVVTHLLLTKQVLIAIDIHHWL